MSRHVLGICGAEGIEFAQICSGAKPRGLAESVIPQSMHVEAQKDCVGMARRQAGQGCIELIVESQCVRSQQTTRPVLGRTGNGWCVEDKEVARSVLIELEWSDVSQRMRGTRRAKTHTLERCGVRSENGPSREALLVDGFDDVVDAKP